MRCLSTLFIALILVAGLASESAAQQLGGRIALDGCYNLWFLEDYEWRCYVHVFDPGGSGSWSGPGYDPALSPDGKRVAFVGSVVSDLFSQFNNITVVNLEDGSRTVVLDDGGSPAWSADGRIAFDSGRSGARELYVMNADGTGVRQLTFGVGFRGQPSWSPDGRIAFQCEIDPGNWDICSIRSDGTAFTRLTNSAESEWAPAFSPDGTRIAFVGLYGLSILNADGSVSHLSVPASVPAAWSPDGSRLAYHGEGYACEADGRLCYGGVGTINVDGSGGMHLSGGSNPSWSRSPGGFPPAASFTASCMALTCTFDESRSQDDSAVVSFQWTFGDGTTGTGMTPVHSYAAAGTYTVELTVIDDTGARGTAVRALTVVDYVTPIASFAVQCNGLWCTFYDSGSFDPDGIASYQWSFGDGTVGSGDRVHHGFAAGTYTVTLTVFDNTGASATKSVEISVTNNQPVAMFVSSCDAFTPICAFNGGGSSDSDGSIVSYRWRFGDGTEGSGMFVTHTYAAAGTYSVTLTVTDNYGATSTRAASVTVASLAVHVADLDGAKDVQTKYWTAFVSVTIHDADHRPVSARVEGVWSSGGSGSCTGDSSGVCTVAGLLPTSKTSVTFSVLSVSFGTAMYEAGRNHDVDGETNATKITITRK